MKDYPDDAERLTRLAEEVTARLEEIALIATRIAGIKLDHKSVRTFSPRPVAVTASADAGTPAVLTMVEILDTPSGTMCATWWSDGTVGLDSPCGHEIYHSH